MKTKSTYKYNSVATLGNQLTCSYFCAKQYCRTKTIQLYNSFEDAAKAVKEGFATALFVPAAFPDLRMFIMDDFFRVKETEVIQIPALVLAGKKTVQPELVKYIFLHPAPERLLSEVDVKFGKAIFVRSNPEACTEVLANETDSVALTNEIAASYYGLTIYKVVRSGIFMPFVIFTH
jgi:prephenate dehydratase